MPKEIKASGVGADGDLPFSQAIVHNKTVYLSGQIGMDPQTGEIVAGGIKAETEQALNNIASILTETDSSLDNIVKTTVYLKDIDDFEEFNNKYSEFFSKPYPARSAFEVSDFAIDMSVEIEAIAALNS